MCILIYPGLQYNPAPKKGTIRRCSWRGKTGKAPLREGQESGVLLWLMASQLFLWVPFPLPVSGPPLSTRHLPVSFPTSDGGQGWKRPARVPADTLDSGESMAETKQLWDLRCALVLSLQLWSDSLSSIRKRLTHMQPSEISIEEYLLKGKICS